MEIQSQLALDRSLANLKFESWRLGIGLVSEPHIADLPSPTFQPDICDTDYVHARNSALHNGVFTQPGGRFMFLKGPQGPELYMLTNAYPPQIEHIYRKLILQITKFITMSYKTEDHRFH